MMSLTKHEKPKTKNIFFIVDSRLAESFEDLNSSRAIS